MAQAAGRGLQELILEVASTYPAAVRYGGGYWSEMVGNVSGHLADVLEALIAVARQPDRSREVLTDLMESSRQYLIASGSTFERMLLDFNQALTRLSRLVPAATPGPGRQEAAVGGDRMIGLLQQVADLAASGALKLQSAQGSPDVEALLRQFEACLAELRRLETRPGTEGPPRVDHPGSH